MNALEKQVLRLIGESVSSPDVFLDTPEGIAPIRDSINDAIEEISSVSGGYTETFTIPLLAGQTFYRLKFERGHFAYVKYCWHVGNKHRLVQTDLHALNAWDPRWMVHSDTPSSYLQVGLDVLGFVPKPSGTSETVEATAVVIPSPYERDNERIKLRSEFRFAVVNFAVSEYYAGRGDVRAADEHYALYAKTITNHLATPEAMDRIWTSATRKEGGNVPELGLSA